MNDTTDFQPTTLDDLVPNSPTDNAPDAQPAVPASEPSPAPSEEMGVAPQSEAAPAPPAEDSQPEVTGTVPRAALEDERHKRQELERQIHALTQQQQPPQYEVPPPPQAEEVPDLWVDPEKALAYQAEQLRQEFKGQMAAFQQSEFDNRVAVSERLLSMQHEDYDAASKVYADAAKSAAERGNLDMLHALRDHPMPAQYAYEVGKQMLAMQQVGSDPDAYRAKLRAEIIAEMQQGQGQAQAPAVSAPTSLASAPSAPAPASQNGGFDGPTDFKNLVPD